MGHRRNSFVFLVLVLASVDLSAGECKFTRKLNGDCEYLCQLVFWADGHHVGHEMAYLALEHAGSCPGRNVLMTFQYCTFPDNRLGVDWFVEGEIDEVKSLVINQCNLTSIDDGAIAKYQGFKNLRELEINGSPGLTTIHTGIFRGLENPNFSYLSWGRNGLIQVAETQAFQHLAPTLKELFMWGNDGFMSAQILANITGECQPVFYENLEMFSLRDMYHVLGVPVLSQRLYSAIKTHSPVLTLNLYGIWVEFIEDKNFLEPFVSPYLQELVIYLDNNHLTNIPPGSFDSLIELDIPVRISMFLNPWHCDCHMQYLQDVFNDPTNKITLSRGEFTICYSPESQYNQLITEADMSTECEPLPSPPALQIQC